MKNCFVFKPRKNYNLKQGKKYRILFDGTILNDYTGIEIEYED